MPQLLIFSGSHKHRHSGIPQKDTGGIYVSFTIIRARICCMNKFIFTLFILFQSGLAFAAYDGWHAGIVDPTILGWLIVVVYLVAVFCCVKQARVVKMRGGGTKFWIFLTVFLLLLAINKQLDLQSWLTQATKGSALANRWYEYREPVQIAFICIIGLSMLIVGVTSRLYLISSWRHYPLAWVGAILLFAFILMRAFSFHHFDIFINHDVLGIKINVIIEIGAVLLIILGAIFNKKLANPLTERTVPLKEYVEIAKDGDDVQCPRCGAQPLSKPVDGRLFKCRLCSYKYTVHLINK